jgi:hypothetical protein
VAINLFGDEEPVKTKRARKAALPAKTDGSTARLMAIYQDEHMKRHGCSAALGTTYAHAMRIFKELAAQFGEPVVADVIRAFMWTKDVRIATGGYTVKELNFHAPRIRLQLNGRPQEELDPVTAHNLAAAERLRRR